MTTQQPAFDALAINWCPAPGDAILIATDEHGIDTARLLLATLPASARGTVFLEVESADGISVVQAPPRISVRWLVRTRGQRLERSVDAWLQEMLPVTAFGEARVYAWVASRGPARLLTSD
jgi:NADPH-dependent ferric siderophore reductase